MWRGRSHSIGNQSDCQHDRCHQEKKTDSDGQHSQTGRQVGMAGGGELHGGRVGMGGRMRVGGRVGIPVWFAAVTIRVGVEVGDTGLEL